MAAALRTVPMPRLGLTSRAATVLAWYVGPGDRVERGTPLCQVETEKTTVDVEAPCAGVVAELCAAAGEALPVGAPLVRLAAGVEAPAGPAAVEEAPAGAAAGAPGWRRVPLTPMRRTIAQRLLQGARATVPVTLTREVDVAGAVARLAAPVTLTDLVVQAAAAALAEYPDLHARWDEDALLYPDTAHICLAVAVDGGLVAPVLRNPAGLSLAELAQRRRELAERARAGALRPEDLEGGTFTVSNLGMYGVDAFTPVINPPQTAILGVGRLLPRPVAVGDKVAVHPTVVLSLTFDHRVVDGAVAAGFLGRVAGWLGDPPSSGPAG